MRLRRLNLLRALYRRAPTLIEHQQLAREVLGFRGINEHEQRALLHAIREELARTSDRHRLLRFARTWMYEHRLIIVHERQLRSIIRTAMHQFEATLAGQVRAAIGVPLCERWRNEIALAHSSGMTMQSWLFAPPAKHSTRQIDEVFECIDKLYELRVHHHLQDAHEGLSLL